MPSALALGGRWDVVHVVCLAVHALVWVWVWRYLAEGRCAGLNVGLGRHGYGSEEGAVIACRESEAGLRLRGVCGCFRRFRRCAWGALSGTMGDSAMLVVQCVCHGRTSVSQRTAPRETAASGDRRRGAEMGASGGAGMAWVDPDGRPL